MRVAFLIGSTHPEPNFGGEVHNLNLAKSLARNAAQVDLYGSSFDRAMIETNMRQIKILGETSGGDWYPLTARSVLALFRQVLSIGRRAIVLRHYDAVVSELGAAWQVLLCFPLLRAPAILDEHNVEWHLMRQQSEFSSGHLPWERLRIYEKLCHGIFNRVLVVSERDRMSFLADGTPKTKLIVVPNGVDTEAFIPDSNLREATRAKYGIPPSSPLVLFMGSMRFFPNVDAARTVVQRILPESKRLIPSLKMMILGGSARRVLGRGDADLIVLDAVNHSALPSIINAADICIAPLRFGSGTRLKLLEWMSCGKAIIATSKASEGIGVTRGRHIVIEDDPGMYPQVIERLWKEPGYRSEIGHYAREFAEESLELRISSAPLISVLDSSRQDDSRHPAREAPETVK